MAKITNIKQQVKNKDRVSIYVDGKYSLSLSVWQIGSAGIKVGLEVEEGQLEKLKADSDFGKLYDRTLNWILIRPRSSWELEEYLRKKTDDEAIKNKIVERVKEKNYVNDEDFAQRWVANRRLLKPMSKLKLKQELIKKRVPAEIIDQTLDGDETDESKVLLEMIEKKRRITRYQDGKKLMEYLARQGFRYGDIKDAFEKLEEN